MAEQQTGLSRASVRLERARHQRAHGIHRGPHHLPDDGLHHLRQPDDPRRSRHGQGRGVRRHLSCGGGVDAGDGALRELPDRARARHGAERLLRLHRRARLQIHVAAGARRGVPLRRAVLPDLGLPHPRIRDQRDPAQPEVRDLGRRRPVPRHHRAGAGEDRRRPSGDAGDARPAHRQAGAAGAALPARLRPDRRAERAQRHRRHADRHPRRRADRHCRSGSRPSAASSRCRPRSRRRCCSSISRARSN